MIENDTKGLPSGWQRAETLNGVPYYINHASETTHWNHPQMAMLMNEMALADDIKYAAYRTAVKLRAIEKKIQVDSINLPTIRAVFNDLEYPEKFSENKIDIVQLKEILTEIFTREHKKGGDVNIATGLELTLNWLLNVYDLTRSGFVRILSAKIGLACLSVASVQEKYKYIFDQISSSKGFIDKKRLRVFLKDALQIVEYVKEYHCFGRSGVEPTVNSCLERAFIPERISLQEFLDWMIDEPQTLVWLPTLHRLAMSETVKHEGKCNICKAFPIVGFRYRCLKCFNFDMCQNCFWSGRIAKNHKLHHQTQEYCLPATQKEDIKDFAKVMKSKVKKKKKKAPRKGRYLPVTSEDGGGTNKPADEYTDFVDYADNESKTSSESPDIDTESERLSETKSIPKSDFSSSEVLTTNPYIDDEHDMTSSFGSNWNNKSPPTSSTPFLQSRFDADQLREMEQIVESLEDDNRFLREKILDIQDLETRRYVVEESSEMAKYNERLEARQEVLEDHNRRLADQLSKLRHLVQQTRSNLPSNVSIRPKEVRNHVAGGEDVVRNRFQSSDHPCDPTGYRHVLPSYSYERLRPVSSVLEQPRLTPASAFLTPSSKHVVPPFSQPATKNQSVEHAPSFLPEDASEVLGKESGASKSTVRPSVSSDEDLRAIEVKLEELLEPDSPEILERNLWSCPGSRGSLLGYPDSDSSDEQQKYLLTAASMVGEAMDDLVFSLSRKKSDWKHLKLDWTGDEDEI